MTKKEIEAIMKRIELLAYEVERDVKLPKSTDTKRE